jgi:hypothetical protein
MYNCTIYGFNTPGFLKNLTIDLKIKKYLLVLIIALLTGNLSILHGQILDDSASMELIKDCIGSIYNFKFDKARDAARQLSKDCPDHPVNHLLTGMISYWENYPLTRGSREQGEYEKYMNDCIKISEEAKITNDYPEILLSNLGARGMLLEFYADNNLSDKVIPIVKTTYRLIRKSFDYTSFYDDFYFFTGLYNYYREAYPEARPVYRVVAFLFPRGDKAKGLIEMRKAARTSIMLKAESASFLAHVYIHFEANFQLAYAYSMYLSEMYPDNIQYLATNIKNLLLLKKYDDAETVLASSASKEKNLFYAAQVEIFKGIIQEKKYKNLKLAKLYYNNGLNEISSFGYFGNEYSAYAYFGLSRLAELEGDKVSRKIYRKKALDLTSYKKVNFDD